LRFFFLVPLSHTLSKSNNANDEAVRVVREEGDLGPIRNHDGQVDGHGSKLLALGRAKAGDVEALEGEREEGRGRGGDVGLNVVPAHAGVHDPEVAKVPSKNAEPRGQLELGNHVALEVAIIGWEKIKKKKNC